jgi:hypothetical protein
MDFPLQGLRDKDKIFISWKLAEIEVSGLGT